MEKRYASLSKELQERIMSDREAHRVNPYRCNDEDVVRRDNSHDRANLWRPAFVRDVEKILHIPYYNRYMDKTQVFSLYRNDDITRRGQHVQLVARIARNIGNVLGLNQDLIEAAALGHDIGHTPFGHAGERKLNQLYHADTGRYFNHNIHSARVLDTIFPLNLSLQTLDGIICHNGEVEAQNYQPVAEMDFLTFDKRMEECYLQKGAVNTLRPATLEGCVVRVSDIIAYLGKDRQDAMRLGMLKNHQDFTADKIGAQNAEIINNMVINILENSYGKDHLEMDEECFEAFSRAKRENYELIYHNDELDKIYEENIDPMFEKLYAYLRKDLMDKGEHSLIFKEHVEYVESFTKFYARGARYREEPVSDLVVDYLASMTDDYFVDLFRELFPDSNLKVSYKGYFDR